MHSKTIFRGVFAMPRQPIGELGYLYPVLIALFAFLILLMSWIVPRSAQAETHSFSNQGHATLSLRLKPVAVIQAFPVKLSDLGQLDGSSSQFAAKVVMDKLEAPVYLSDDRLKEALLQSSYPFVA